MASVGRNASVSACLHVGDFGVADEAGIQLQEPGAVVDGGHFIIANLKAIEARSLLAALRCGRPGCGKRKRSGCRGKGGSGKQMTAG